MEQKTLIIIGAVVVLTGVIIILFGVFSKFLPIFRLPGDIAIEKENFSFYFPIVSSIVLSIILSVILNIIAKFFK
ncbi:MAG: DUF2905 domain-containing protein [Brevinematia bacterium]